MHIEYKRGRDGFVICIMLLEVSEVSSMEESLKSHAQAEKEYLPAELDFVVLDILFFFIGEECILLYGLIYNILLYKIFLYFIILR